MVSENIKYSIYTPSEAAWYLNIHTRNVDNWLHIEPKFEYKNPFQDQDKYIDFNDFIQLVAIKELRLEHISFQKIRDAHRIAKIDYGIDNILTAKHKLYWDKRDIFLELNNTPVCLTGDSRRQSHLKPIIRNYLQNIVWTNSHQPEKYYPLGIENNIVMAPSIRNGEPVVESCLFRAETFYNAYLGENKNSEFVAKLYNVEESEVLQAYDYIESLNVPPCRLRKAA